MKKDLPQTQNNAQGHQTHGKDDDTGQPTKDNGSRQAAQDTGSRHPTKDNDNGGSQLTKYNDTKQDNDKKAVQGTQDINTDSRHLTQVIACGKQTKDIKISRQQTQYEEKTISKVTTKNQPIELSLRERRQERLQDNETITETQKQKQKHGKKTSKTKEKNRYEMQEKKICMIRKIITYIQILMLDWLNPKRKKKKLKQCTRFGEKFKVFFTLLIFIPAGHSYIIRDSKMESKNTNNVEKLLFLTETVQNNGDIDNDSITTSTLNLTTKKPCFCPTTGQAISTISTSSTSTQSTSPGTTTPSVECVCPDVTQSLAEEETATNMPIANGRRRRRRKEIADMDLFVDEFDQKILKKMPFLESY